MRGLPSAPLWLALLAAAQWPSLLWLGRRLADGSDEPLALLALGALALLVVRARGRWRAAPQPLWLALSLAAAVLATALRARVPELLIALPALLSLTAGLLAWLPARPAAAPVLGLGLLALPLLASLQFYAGFPLRVLTAEASRVLLGLAHRVERSGSSLIVDGQLVLVDAPCSGVQMAWLAYFSACVLGLHAGLGSAAWLRRLPVVGLAVLAANVLRNTLLVGAQAGGRPFSPAGHEALGLVVQAALCGVLVLLMRMRAAGTADGPEAAAPAARCAPWVQRWGAGLLLLCSLGASVQAGRQAPPPAAPVFTDELPSHWRGAPLRPLALSEVEQRFAQQFPGQIARLSSGSQTLVLRQVQRATRRLHPAMDCYRGLGFAVRDEAVERQEDGRLWRCFVAARGGQRLRVCEHLEDAQGQGFTDASAWTWAVWMGQSQGPWRALTVATPL